MTKRFFLAWLVIFVAWMLLSYAVHGVLLDAEYDKLPNLFRPDAEARQNVGLIVLAHVLMAGAFVWIYAHGVEAKSWVVQGLRFGIAVALVNEVPNYLIYFAVQPWPAALVAKQIGLDGAGDVVLGLLVAALYDRPVA
jgi:hypothetical protein